MLRVYILDTPGCSLSSIEINSINVNEFVKLSIIKEILAKTDMKAEDAVENLWHRLRVS